MGLGTILRLLGYLIEGPCLLGLLQVRVRAQHAPGPIVESLLYVGVVAGVGLIIAGNVVNARVRRRPKDRWDLPRDSP
jgi:hypothetical protein